eukprot:GHVS01064668.1.p1 GENE.GHVS01064668.1~~GHVS01064668.1.p1  ORF type:complete len:429 (+),score=53.38 GHVS01064668.1:228-1514(+)
MMLGVASVRSSVLVKFQVPHTACCSGRAKRGRIWGLLCILLLGQFTMPLNAQRASLASPNSFSSSSSFTPSSSGHFSSSSSDSSFSSYHDLSTSPSKSSFPPLAHHRLHPSSPSPRLLSSPFSVVSSSSPPANRRRLNDPDDLVSTQVTAAIQNFSTTIQNFSTTIMNTMNGNATGYGSESYNNSGDSNSSVLYDTSGTASTAEDYVNGKHHFVMAIALLSVTVPVGLILVHEGASRFKKLRSKVNAFSMVLSIIIQTLGTFTSLSIYETVSRCYRDPMDCGEEKSESLLGFFVMYASSIFMSVVAIGLSGFAALSTRRSVLIKKPQPCVIVQGESFHNDNFKADGTLNRRSCSRIPSTLPADIDVQNVVHLAMPENSPDSEDILLQVDESGAPQEYKTVASRTMPYLGGSREESQPMLQNKISSGGN